MPDMFDYDSDTKYFGPKHGTKYLGYRQGVYFTQSLDFQNIFKYPIVLQDADTENNGK